MTTQLFKLFKISTYYVLYEHVHFYMLTNNYNEVVIGTLAGLS